MTLYRTFLSNNLKTVTLHLKISKAGDVKLVAININGFWYSKSQIKNRHRVILDYAEQFLDFGEIVADARNEIDAEEAYSCQLS